MTKEDIFKIDVKKILQDKAPEKANKIPGFVTSILSKILCVKGLNDFLTKNGDAQGVDMMENAVKYFDVKLKILNSDNIPSTEERLIFVSNHPLGGLDGICLSMFIGKRFKHKIKYLVNDLLFFIKPLQNIFVPINKHGAQAKQGALAINEAFSSDNQIITFPAGLCSRKISGKIIDSEWKKTFVLKAIEYKRNVVPVHFEARNSNFFYMLANFRTRMGIKINIEMLLLPYEMFKSKGKLLTIQFGEPIPWEFFDNSKTAQQWADWTKELVYDMGKQQ
ncbi:glycerol acyltransferase [Bacteroidales bacterium]|nr:glycerol acyltransferase [Bacteroidales bacterium]